MGGWNRLKRCVSNKHLFKSMSLVKGGCLTGKSTSIYRSSNLCRTGYLGRKQKGKIVNLILQKMIPNSSSSLSDHYVHMHRSFSGVHFSKCWVYELVNCSNIHWWNSEFLAKIWHSFVLSTFNTKHHIATE